MMVVTQRKSNLEDSEGEVEMPPLRKNLSLSDWLALKCSKNSNVAPESSGDKSTSGVEHDDGISLQPNNNGPPLQSPRWKNSTKPLTLLPLIALIFYNVSGGPFGIEESIEYAGPLATILGLILLPIVWSVPEALVSAELSAMFPENSGYVAWITASFGPFWGFIGGFTSWVSGVLDNSLYPLYLAGYVKYFIPGLANRIAFRVFVCASSVIMITWNYLGLAIVGRTAVILVAVVLLPFVIMGLWAIPQIQPKNWLEFDSGTLRKNFMDFLNIMFWNLNYWDSVATLAGEIRKPAKNIPKAFGWAVVMVFLTYLLPILVSVGVMGSSKVDDGYFADVGAQVGGPLLAGLIMISAAASQIGLFESEMSSDAFLIEGMSERGFLPRSMGVKSRFGTPIVGIFLSSLGVITMVMSFDFEDVVDMLNYAYCLSMILEFSAFIYLRIHAPHANRPYRIPLSTVGVCLMLFPASALIAVLLIVPWVQLNIMLVAFNAGVVILALCTYALLSYLRRKFPYIFNPLELGIPKQLLYPDVEAENAPLVIDS